MVRNRTTMSCVPSRTRIGHPVARASALIERLSGLGRMAMARLLVVFACALAVTHPAAAQQTLFTNQIPSLTNLCDGSPCSSYELGMKFRSSVAGQVTAIRYFKDANEPAGNHVGHIWDLSGNLLATTTFLNETGNGWQQQALGAPLSIQANTTYIVSVNLVSHYVDTPGGLVTAVVNGALSSVADGMNGVLGNSGTFPAQSFNSSNYFRDIVFTPGSTPPPTCTGLQKLVSVDGGTTFAAYTDSSSPAIAQANVPVEFKLVVTNCAVTSVQPKTVDDCINANPNAAPFACAPVSAGGQGAPGLILYEPPVTAPVVAGVTYPLPPGATVSYTKAQLPNLLVSAASFAALCQGQTVVRNDAEFDGTDGNNNPVGYDAIAYVKCPQPLPASIALLKQISVDGGATWLDADTAATAPSVTAPHDAQYRLIVSNTGSVTLNNVVVSDPSLGLTNVPVAGGTLTAGQSVTITSGSAGFGMLYQLNRCSSNTTGNITNVATATGSPANGAANVTASNPAVLVCQPPVIACVASSSNASNFNGTSIPSGDYIWFNANFTAKGIPSSGATIFFQSSTIQFGNATVSVPNAQVTFSPTASCASTSFNSATNTWVTIVPIAGSDEIFLSGLSYPLAAPISGGTNPVTWTGTFSTNTPGVQIQWKWGAAVYSTFSANYNLLAVKPTHQNACSVNNGDHAGTPESSYQKYVIGGARGGGGSNFTGSWTGTVSANPVCH